MKPVEQIWAQNTEDLVRKAMSTVQGGRYAKIIAKYPESIVSAYTSDADWIEKDPFHVYVFTESGIAEPYSDEPPYVENYQAFQEAAELIRRDPFIEDAGWESYNAAVQYFWVEPRFVS